MKPKRQTEPTAMERLADEMCALFWERSWQPSVANFQPRPFVEWHGSFFSAAGTNPAGRNCSIACRTAEEVIAFLESVSEEPIAAPEPVVVAAPMEPETFTSEQHYAALEVLRAELEAERAKPPIIVERIVEVPAAVTDATAEWPDLNEKLSDWDEVGHAAVASNIPSEIAELMEPGETLTQARKRLSELLNVEKAELRLKRAAGSATDAELKREADVDRLQGLFSKLGEI